MSELVRDYFLVNSKVNNFANTYAMLWRAIYIAHASDRFLCKQSVCFVRLNFQSLVRDVEFWPSELLKMNILSKQTFWSLLPHTKQNVIHEYVKFVLSYLETTGKKMNFPIICNWWLFIPMPRLWRKSKLKHNLVSIFSASDCLGNVVFS